MKRLVHIVAALLLVAGSFDIAAAQGKAIQLSIFDPLQIVPNTEAISGLRLNLIYTKNTSMTGVDLGFIANMNTGSFTGVQSSLVCVVDGNFTGLQWDFVGLVGGNFEGVQVGFYNGSNHVSGLQFGLINNTGTMKGIQLGLINIIKKGGFLPVFPIVNWSF